MDARSPKHTAPIEQDLEVLRHSFLLTGLSADRQDAALAAISPLRLMLAAGETAVRAGDTFAAIGLVTAGRLSVMREGERRPVIHRTLSRGDTFGVSSLFGGEAFPTTVTAAEPATVLLLDEEDVRSLLAASPLSWPTLPPCPPRSMPALISS